MTKYKLLVDYGKPYIIGVANKKELYTELKKLYDLTLKEDLPFFDLMILDNKGYDISTTKYIKKMIDKIMKVKQ